MHTSTPVRTWFKDAACTSPLPRPRLGVVVQELASLSNPLEVARARSRVSSDLFSAPEYGPPARLHPDAWARLVPDSLKTQLQSIIREKKRVLLVGDRPGDPDCFSAVALARFLRGLGVEADTHVGMDPPRQIKDLFRPGELLTEQQVAAKSYDAVLFVDNDGTGPRISPAAHRAAAKAEDIIVLDHHQPKLYPVGPKQRLTTWIEPRAEAAALLQLGLMAALCKDLSPPPSRDQWADIAEPLFAAIYSDTGGLNPEATKAGALETFHFLGDLLGTQNVRAIMEALQADLPLATQVRIRTQLDPSVIETKGQRGLLCSFVVEEKWDELTTGDLYRGVLDQIDRLRDEHKPAVSLALVGLPADEAFGARVMVSVRTIDKTQASQLAKDLGNGGGKPNGQAGATVLVPEGQTLEGLLGQLREKAQQLLETALDQAQRVSYELGLRRGSL